MLASLISLSDESAPPEISSRSAPEQVEIALVETDDSALPDYPDGISQRLLRKRVVPRALIGARMTSAISAAAICNIQPSSCYRIAPQALYYQHQTSLRI